MVSLSELASPSFALPDAADPSLSRGSLSALAGVGKVKPNFFGQGGTGRNIAGYIGDALLALGGQQPVFAREMAERPQRDLETLIRQTQLAKLQHPDPQAVNLGDGGFATYDPIGGLNVLREPDRTPKPTALEQGIGLYKQYKPNATDDDIAGIIRTGIPGYQYDPTFVQQRQANSMDQIAARASASLATKQAPSYANLHPKATGGGKPSATRVVGGKAYYKIGGTWYDNPEGS